MVSYLDIDLSYLDIDFLDNDPTRTILSKSFPGTLRQFKSLFKQQFNAQVKDKKKNKWVDCLDGCYKVATEYIKSEMNSTAYILRCLQMSMLNNKRLSIYFTGKPKNITGKWKKDKKWFRLLNFRENYNGPGRLIMGFGPSASGKTYWANNLIKILGQKDKLFPDTFMSIDGGIYREASMIYQDIVDITLDNGINGLNNLIPSGISKRNELFPTGDVKSMIRKYLETQNTPNLYVPETLGGCLSRFDCPRKYKKYIKLTKDLEWIGVCIWQHRTGQECTFQPMYQCVGCTESGEKRERTEGKKYSNRAWDISYNNGMVAAKKANTWFIIHNTGGKKNEGLFNISLIESNMIIPTEIQKQYNFEQCKKEKCKLKL